ncbi:MAG TPA: hypothetical protein VIC34_13825 [Croceibacterium sp.]
MIEALALLSAVSLALSVNANATERAAPTTDEQSRNLARELVQIELNEGSVGNLEPLERAISLSISTTLASGNPTLQSALAANVEKQLTPLEAKFTGALTDAYSKDLTASEMRRIVDFMRGPGGQAEAANLPILKSKLASGQAMEPNAVAKMEAATDLAYRRAPQARRDLIERIFKAQNFEEHTRQDFQKLYSRLNTAVSAATDALSNSKGKSSSATTPSDNVESDKEVEADVRRTMAIEKSFYLTHFTDGELGIIATYLESDAGQALLTQLPEIQKTVGSKILTKLDDLMPGVMAAACATAKCTDDQRDKLKQRLGVMQQVLHATL